VRNLSRRVSVAIVLAVCAFGSAFPAVKVGLRSFEPGPLALLRFSAASVAFAVFLAITRMPAGVLREWPRLVFLALANVVAYHLLFNAGQRTVSASAASVLVNTSPICSAVFAVLLLKERPHPRLWIGLVIAFLGAAVIAIAERGALRFSPGATLVFLAAILQGLSFIVQRPTVGRYGAAAVTAMAVWIGTVVLAGLFGPELVRELGHATTESIVAVLYTGCVSTVFGLGFWAYVMNAMPAASASPYLMTVPVVATAVSLVLIGEWPKLSTLAGGVLTLAGIAFGLGYFMTHSTVRSGRS